MIRKNGMRCNLLLATMICCLSAANQAEAVVKNWGHFSASGGGITFADVTEDNALSTTVFAPEEEGPRVVGNMLVFDPEGFESQSNNGAHLIDSTLRTMILAQAGEVVEAITIEEFGDFTLGGLPDGLAIASVGAAFFWSIDEVDNMEVSIPTQIAQLSVTDGGMFERPDHDGTAIPWVGNTTLDVAALLEEYNYDGTPTKISLTFDNTLQTAADNFSNAFIKKKGVKITVNSEPPLIPEPTTGLLGAIAVSLLAARRKMPN